MPVFMEQRISPYVNFERTQKHIALEPRNFVRKNRLVEIAMKKLILFCYFLYFGR